MKTICKDMFEFKEARIVCGNRKLKLGDHVWIGGNLMA